MSINLLDMLKDQVGGQLAKHAGSFLGESESNVTSALGGVFPAILGSVINKSSEPEGASGIMDMIGGLDMGMLGDIGGLFGGGASSVNGLLNSGGGLLDGLFGNKLGGVVDMISKISGLKSGSSSSLLKMAAPFVIGLIGKQIKGKGIGFLTDMLSGQKESVSAAMPSGFGDMLGLGFMSNVGETIKGAASAVTGATGNVVDGAKEVVSGAAGAVTGAAGTVVDGAEKAAGAAVGGAKDAGKAALGAAGNVVDGAGEVAKSGLSFLKWLLPLLLVGIIGYVLYSFVFTDKSVGDALSDVKDVAGDATGAVGDMANKAGEATKDMANKAGDMAKGAVDGISDLASAAFSKVDEVAKAALDKVEFAANSAGSQMMDFIDGGFKGNGKVTFNNLTFASGSDVIDGESGKEVDNLAAILKAYPDVKIAVSGYTDNTGDAMGNKTLSENRAKAVKARLITDGIAGSRITTAGYGDANPVASNDTAEGRAQNRRIEVTIVK